MNWPTEPVRRQIAIRIAICALLAAALHIAAFAVWSGRTSVPPGGGGSPAPHAATVRLTQDTALAESSAPVEPAPSSEAPAADAVAPGSAPAAAPAPPVAAPGPAASPSPHPGSPDDVERIDGIEYLPRRWLSVAPVATRYIAVPYPAMEGDAGWYRTELALFIDAEGAVRRVRVDGPPLPEALEAAAREAFTSVRFKPGQIDGQPVASRLRIQMEFGRQPP